MYARACVGARARVQPCLSIMKSICPILYCYLWPLWLHQSFRQYLIINDTIFGKKVIGHKMCVLILTTTFIQNVSHSKKNPARYYHECENVFS
jgi:hypothetical protein